MTGQHMKRASLAEIRQLKDANRLHHDPGAPEMESLGREFWAEAQIDPPATERRSVHLKLDVDVFEFFKRESGGKGHLTRMQNVLRAYAKAHQG